MSTDRNKSRTGSTSRGRPRKNITVSSQGASIQNDDEFWTCELCKNRFGDPNDKIIECGRCKLYYCAKCLKMSDQTYAALCQAASVSHWFCMTCEAPALHAIRDDREIEEKCKAYFEKMTKRVEELEKELPKKADKTVVDGLCSDMKNFETQMQGAHKDISTLSNRIDMVRNEKREQDRRKNNLVVHGLPEKEEVPDVDLADELLGAQHV